MKFKFSTSLPKATSRKKPTRKQGLSTKGSHTVPQLLFATLLLALALASQGQTPAAQAAPPAQANIVNSTYAMTLEPQQAKLCVGEKKIFTVTIPVVHTVKDPNGDLREVRTWTANEQVNANVEPKQVGEVIPIGLFTTALHQGGSGFFSRRSIGDSRFDPMPLEFIFEAKQKGVTTISFVHTASGSGSSRRAPTLTAQVEVVDCYEGKEVAGFHTTWFKKDICTLDSPFGLMAALTTPKSVADPLSTTGISQWPYYWVRFSPSSTPFGAPGLAALQNGTYTLKGLQTMTIPKKTLTCTMRSSGTYEVVTYGIGEGDLLISGPLVMVCENLPYPTYFTVFRILIKIANPPPSACLHP